MCCTEYNCYSVTEQGGSTFPRIWKRGWIGRPGFRTQAPSKGRHGIHRPVYNSPSCPARRAYRPGQAAPMNRRPAKIGTRNARKHRSIRASHIMQARLGTLRLTHWVARAVCLANPPARNHGMAVAQEPGGSAGMKCRPEIWTLASTAQMCPRKPW